MNKGMTRAGRYVLAVVSVNVVVIAAMTVTVHAVPALSTHPALNVWSFLALGAFSAGARIAYIVRKEA